MMDFVVYLLAFMPLVVMINSHLPTPLAALIVSYVFDNLSYIVDNLSSSALSRAQQFKTGDLSSPAEDTNPDPDLDPDPDHDPAHSPAPIHEVSSPDNRMEQVLEMLVQVNADVQELRRGQQVVAIPSPNDCTALVTQLQGQLVRARRDREAVDGQLRRVQAKVDVDYFFDRRLDRVEAKLRAQESAPTVDDGTIAAAQKMMLASVEAGQLAVMTRIEELGRKYDDAQERQENSIAQIESVQLNQVREQLTNLAYENRGLHEQHGQQIRALERTNDDLMRAHDTYKVAVEDSLHQARQDLAATVLKLDHLERRQHEHQQTREDLAAARLQLHDLQVWKIREEQRQHFEDPVDYLRMRLDAFCIGEPQKPAPETPPMPVSPRIIAFRPATLTGPTELTGPVAVPFVDSPRPADPPSSPLASPSEGLESPIAGPVPTMRVRVLSNGSVRLHTTDCPEHPVALPLLIAPNAAPEPDLASAPVMPMEIEAIPQEPEAPEPAPASEPAPAPAPVAPMDTTPDVPELPDTDMEDVESERAELDETKSGQIDEADQKDESMSAPDEGQEDTGAAHHAPADEVENSHAAVDKEMTGADSNVQVFGETESEQQEGPKPQQNSAPEPEDENKSALIFDSIKYLMPEGPTQLARATSPDTALSFNFADTSKLQGLAKSGVLSIIASSPPAPKPVVAAPPTPKSTIASAPQVMKPGGSVEIYPGGEVVDWDLSDDETPKKMRVETGEFWFGGGAIHLLARRPICLLSIHLDQRAPLKDRNDHDKELFSKTYMADLTSDQLARLDLAWNQPQNSFANFINGLNTAKTEGGNIRGSLLASRLSGEALEMLMEYAASRLMRGVCAAVTKDKDLDDDLVSGECNMQVGSFMNGLRGWFNTALAAISKNSPESNTPETDPVAAVMISWPCTYDYLCRLQTFIATERVQVYAVLDCGLYLEAAEFASRVRDKATKTSEKDVGGLGGRFSRCERAQLDAMMGKWFDLCMATTASEMGLGDDQVEAARHSFDKDVDLWCREISDVKGRTIKKPKGLKSRPKSNPAPDAGEGSFAFTCPSR